jgi:glycine cleavage system aminomethyltransferase T
MKTLALFLMLANAYALTPKGMVAEDYIYFKNNKHLLNLTIHKNLHPKDKEVIKYWLKKDLAKKSYTSKM